MFKRLFTITAAISGLCSLMLPVEARQLTEYERLSSATKASIELCQWADNGHRASEWVDFYARKLADINASAEVQDEISSIMAMAVYLSVENTCPQYSDFILSSFPDND